MYLWLLFARRWSALSRTLLLCVALVALPTLFYQNSGWLQFGYRFSNDYAVFLFALLALGGWHLRRGVLLLALCGVLVSTFGALSFGRPEYARYYFAEPSQRVLYQPD
jgi:hypothetical protein